MTAADLLPSLAGLVVLSLVMGAAWARQRRTGNAGLVDVIWSASIGALAALHLATADGWLPRRLLVCGTRVSTVISTGCKGGTSTGTVESPSGTWT